MTPCDAAHSTNLLPHPELVDGSRGTEHRAQQSCEQWTGGVASNGGSLGTESTIQVPRNAASDPWLRRDTVVTAWEKQGQDYEQQSGDKISDAIKLGVVLHHLPDASLREHLLLNSRVYDTYALMAAEIRSVAISRTTWLGPARRI